MDTRTQQSPDVPLILLGSHWVGPQDLKWDQRPASAEAVFDVAPLLKDRKTIKLMAKQDRMALAAAAGALRQAGLSESDRRDRTGVARCRERRGERASIGQTNDLGHRIPVRRSVGDRRPCRLFLVSNPQLFFDQPLLTLTKARILRRRVSPRTPNSRDAHNARGCPFPAYALAAPLSRTAGRLSLPAESD